MEQKELKGIDLGYRKLIVTSDGKVYGENLRQIIDGTFSPVMERLKNLKKGKSGKWAKSVNRKFNHWIYSYVLKRIKELCEVVGVQCHIVPPQHTSRTCPECGYQDKLNRNGDVFKCLRCGYQEDADVVGAKNVLRRFIEEPIVPLPAKPVSIVE